MKQSHILLIVLTIVLLLVGAVEIPGIIAGDITPGDMKEGKIEKASTEITLDKGAVSFTDKSTGLSASTTTTINGVKFIPSKTTEGKELEWSTGELDSVVKMVYSYDGKTLKETITLKEDKVLTFPITLATYSKLIPWDNGQWKIVASNSFETMKGIVLEKPYGIDAAGKRIEMEYTYKDGVLALVYDRTITEWVEEDKIVIDNKTGTEITERVLVQKQSQIAYPLVIDPTWVAYNGHWIDNTTNATHTIEMWNATGITSWTPQTGVTSIEYLVVAGGGGGGYGYYGGGGGAGGFRTATEFSVTPGVSLNVTVGAGGGGSAASNVRGTNGANSSFTNTTPGTGISAAGGGGGGSRNSAVAGAPCAGSDGGSGGGASFVWSAGGLNVTGQGFPGGSNGYAFGAGGGGASMNGSVGVDGSGITCGGSGLSSNITGTLTYYAGGGGGGGGYNTQCGSTGGLGGGGLGGRSSVRGGTAAGTAGTNGLGAGGGGAGEDVTSGYNGGSGIVIIKYLTPSAVVSLFTSKNVSLSINVTAGWVGLEPFTMQFNDTSTQTPTNWSWGAKNIAGNNTWVSRGTTNNITAIFGGGYYAINLTATNLGSSNISQDLYISVIGNGTPTPSVVTPVASFYGSPTIGSPPLLVYLTDASSNTPTSWNWSFGNGVYSETQNPSYTYTKSGFYTVGLTATNSAGSNTTSKVRYITAY